MEHAHPFRLEPEPLEDGFITAALKFANTGEQRWWEELHRDVFEAGGGVPPCSPSAAVLNAQREVLRNALESFVGHGHPTPDAIAAWEERVNRLESRISFDVDEKLLLIALKVKPTETFESPPSPVIAYVLLHLVFERGGDSARKCAHCGDFFLQQKTRGMTRQKYCCREHMTAAHKAGASERMRRSRKERERARQLKTRRRK